MENNKKSKDEITFISLLTETIVGIFVSGSSSKEEQNDYHIKEKWMIWAKNIFNLNNFKNIFKKLFKGLAYFIVIFSIINLLIFTPLVVNQLKSSRYPVPRAYLKSAFMINQIYIIPISKIFGYGNPLTWGFYPIKDGLYNSGMSRFPKDEGEREIWWFNIRFVEYKTIVQPALMASYTYNDKTYKRLPRWQVKSFEKWNDELYTHILSWPNAKISDPTYKKEKLIRFVDLVEAYIDSTSVLSTKLQITAKDYIIPPNDINFKLPYAKPEDVKNYLNVINIYNNLKADSTINDKESHDYFEKNKRYYEDKFLYEATLNLIGSESDWGPSIICDSPEVTILGKSHKNMVDYYNKNKNNMKFGEKGTIEILTSVGIPGFTNKKCTQTPALNEYNEYFIEKSKRFAKYRKGENR